MTIISTLFHYSTSFSASHYQSRHSFSFGYCVLLSRAQKERIFFAVPEIAVVNDAPVENMQEVLSAYDDADLYPDRRSYEGDRITYNMGLQSLLRRGRQAEVDSNLQRLKEQGVKLNVDTVHILISNSFAKKEISNVEQYYRQYFRSGELLPTSRTLNILMEGYRSLRDEAKVFYYRDCFETFKISMDSYSYSTLIRAARDASTVKSILYRAESGNALSPPLLRCAIESLGKLGDPMGAVLVASKMAPKNSITKDIDSSSNTYLFRSMFDSIASADSLIIALLENPQLYLSLSNPEYDTGDVIGASGATDTKGDILYSDTRQGGIEAIASSATKSFSLEKSLIGMQCGDAAISLILASSSSPTNSATASSSSNRLNNLKKSSKYPVSASNAAGDGLSSFGQGITIGTREKDPDPVLVCGSKGWCRVFTFLQRSIKECLEEQEQSKDYMNNNKLRNRFDASKMEMKRLRDIRDRLWIRLSSEILEIETKRNKIAEGGASIGRFDGGQTSGVVSLPTIIDDAVLTEGEDAVDEGVSATLSAVQVLSPVTSTVYTRPSPGMKSREYVEINGRLSDAILRCYIDDAEKAKKMWKTNILPMTKRITSGYGPDSASSFNEVCEKSLEALMFVSGYNSRADLGFEISLTVRNRNWDSTARGKLAKAYVQGKVQSKSHKSPWLRSNLLNDGLERSIESELGVQLLDFYPNFEGSSRSGARQGYNTASRREGGGRDGDREGESQWPQRIRIQFRNDAAQPPIV